MGGGSTGWRRTYPGQALSSVSLLHVWKAKCLPIYLIHPEQCLVILKFNAPRAGVFTGSRSRAAGRRDVDVFIHKHAF